MEKISLSELIVAFKGAGEIASAIAWRLYQANLRRIFMLEIARPLAVRREVSFCEAIEHDRQAVEGVEAIRAASEAAIRKAWSADQIPVCVDPQWDLIAIMQAHVVVDATIAKRNLGTHLDEAPLVIGLGPGFEAGRDVHTLIETNRGHNLGRIILSGSAEPNTGVPGTIGGQSAKRVLRAPCDGHFRALRQIRDMVKAGDTIGEVDGQPVTAAIDGVVRGLIATDIPVTRGLKLGDVDPRGDVSYCGTISDKGRAIGGSVLEAILRVYNRS
jgi:xanthine dehydrogenase accessory factor